MSGVKEGGIRKAIICWMHSQCQAGFMFTWKGVVVSVGLLAALRYI